MTMQKIIYFFICISLIVPHIFADTTTERFTEQELQTSGLTAAQTPTSDLTASVYKEKIAIAPFDVNTGIDESYARTVQNKIGELLSRTKRFDIVEREQLSAVLQEQELHISGLVDPDTAVHVGSLLGAQYIVIGSINSTEGQYSIQESIKSNKRTGIVNTFYKITYTAVVSISGRFVSVEQGKIKLTETVIGKDSKSEKFLVHSTDPNKPVYDAVTLEREAQHSAEAHIPDALINAAYRLAAEIMAHFPLDGYVVAITGRTVLLDLGSENGLKSKVNARVYAPGEAYIHPVNGRSLNAPRVRVGLLQITNISDHASIGRLVYGSPSHIKPGYKAVVVKPVFNWKPALASLLVPGLGQIIHRKIIQGIVWMGLDALCISGYYLYRYYGSDAYLHSQDYFDSTEWEIKNGTISNGGDNYTAAVRQAHLWQGIFITFGIIFHTANVISAGFPAERNKTFSLNNETDVRVACYPHCINTEIIYTF